MKRGELRRKKGLDRHGWARRTGRLNPVSDKRKRYDDEWAEARQKRAESVAFVCEGQVAGICEGYGSHGHHVIRDRTLNTVNNCRWLCAPCHRYAHEHPAIARALGLLASKFTPQEVTP